VVTIPSPSEGKRRFEQAVEGLEKLKEQVDSLLVISNEKLHKIYGDLPASQAFKKADDILATAVKGVAEIITLHGNINIDFADVNTVMTNSKVFIMGTGIAEGSDRAMNATQLALESPLLDSNDIYGSKDILLNITSGKDEITMGEIGDIIEHLQEKAGQDANIIWGNGIDHKLGDKISVTIIATRFDKNPSQILQEPETKEEFVLETQDCEINLEDDDENQIDLNFENPKIEEPVLEEAASTQTKEKNKQPAETEKVDSWFQRQFNRLFDDQDDTKL
jgi:cell division protein FtsZ